MRRQSIILICEIMLCILILTAMYLITHHVYADVFRIGTAASLPTSWIVITILNWKKETDTDRPKARWFTLVVVAVAIAVFAVAKPNITYEEGKSIVSAQGYENLYELQDKSILAFGLKHTKLVPEAYLYVGERNSIKYYILLSPIDGEIDTELIGDGNYLDMYFDVKYGQRP